MTIQIDMGKRIKQARKQLGITQQALADAVGFDRSYLSKIESGVAECSASQLYHISKFLRVPVSVFYGEEQHDSNLKQLANDLEQLTPQDRSTFEKAIHALAQSPDVKKVG
jgi:transcriptional regulator with XRE-family HTH domain